MPTTTCFGMLFTAIKKRKQVRWMRRVNVLLMKIDCWSRQ